MDVSPNILRRDTVQLLGQINTQIAEVEEHCRRRHLPPEKLVDEHGNWVMIPLLLAKAQAYSTLVQLQGKK